MLSIGSYSADSTDSTTSLSSGDSLSTDPRQSSHGLESNVRNGRGSESLQPPAHARLAPQPSDSLLVVGEGALRRTRSLRERTGVDERLDRIPIALCHTFSLPGTQLNCPGKDVHKHRPVKIKDFAEHVSLMQAENDFRFSIEYEELKNIGRTYSCQAGEREGNKDRNRFHNVLPFDHTRVVLSSLPQGLDYINANYIPGENGPKEYIATQGPLSSTLIEFWALIWEQEARAIINLTKCVERGKEKCARYWPKHSEEDLEFQDFRIHLKSQTDLGDWSVRELEVFRRGEEEEGRGVVQWHFTAWPDFDTPSTPHPVLSFLAHFRARFPARLHLPPVIVHCSAGIGRTGTWIALDQLFQSIHSAEQIDVFGTVYEMRHHRISMVQTIQQYGFIHQCLLHAIASSSSQESDFENESCNMNEDEEEDESMLGKSLRSLRLSSSHPPPISSSSPRPHPPLSAIPPKIQVQISRSIDCFEPMLTD